MSLPDSRGGTTALSPDLALRLLAQSNDAIIYADREGVIRLWNAAATRMFGFSSEETLARSLDIFIPERLRAAHWAGYERAMMNGRGRHDGTPTRTKALTRSGETVFVEMSFSIITDEAGIGLGSLAVARLAPAVKHT